ncbi:MAG: DUF3822 family protein [Staphylococcus sp.]|nr:DUF3822 family protein [Staphylococcus sp.]
MANVILNERIENPEMWNLLLRLSDSEVHVVIYSIVEDNSLVHERFDLDTASTPWITAVENVIYDHPALLSDFRRVYCVVGTVDYTIVPLECREREVASVLFNTAFPATHLEMSCDDTGTRNALVLMGIEPELRGFINRTFQHATIVSHIASLCRYASAKADQGNKVKMIANVHQSSLDVVVTDGRTLLMANTFAFTDIDDAVYYLLASRSRLGLDQTNDEILLAGDQQTREKLTPALRTYISRVMPMIFPPQMFKAGKDALTAPFDLIITPLCE